MSSETRSNFLENLSLVDLEERRQRILRRKQSEQFSSYLGELDRELVLVEEEIERRKNKE